MKKNIGITLIALVITIIVLLILAGVTIQTLTGDNGLITKANEAKISTEEAKLEEEVQLAFVEYEADKHTNSNAKMEDKLKDIFEKIHGIGNITVVKSGKNYKVNVKDSKTTYRVRYDGKVKKYEEMDPTNVYGKLDENNEMVYLRATETSGYVKFTTRVSNELNNDHIKKVIIEEPIAPTITNLFELCTNLERIENIENLHTENMASMNWMFYNCKKLTELDVSRFDTSKVKNLGNMFRECNNLISIDVSGFDTSKVTSLSSMFSGCSKLNNIDVTSFNTGNVVDMSSMFSSCSALTQIDVSGFDTSKVKNMADMFYSCSKLKNINIKNFDTSSLENIRYMFAGCQIENLDISNFDTSKVTKMDNMFKGCTKLKSLNLGRSFVINDEVNTDQMIESTSNYIIIKSNKDTASKLKAKFTNLTDDNFEIIE